LTAGARAFYRLEESRYVPTGIGVSPWNGKTQNGVSVAGLAAHLFAKAGNPVAMLPGRFTVDLYGAPPMCPMTPQVNILREGRSTQVVEVKLLAEGRTWLRATGVRVRIANTPTVAEPTSPEFPDAEPSAGTAGYAEWIRLAGNFQTPGPGAQWLRLYADVVEGEPLQPFEALVMAADFGTGIAPPLRTAEWSLANVDLSIHLSRLPESSWLFLDAVSHTAGNGYGVTNTQIGDRRGMFATAHQTMFISEARTSAP